MRGGGIRSRARRAAGDERGITLVELMVAIVVLGLLSTMVVSIYVQTTRTVTASSNLSQNTKTASNIMNEMSRVIRSATNNSTGNGLYDSAIVDAKADSLTILAYVDADAVNPRPVRVTFAINATSRQIVETRWSAKAGSNGLWIFDSSNPLISTRTLPGTIIAGNGPLFRYYKGNRTTEIIPPTAGLDDTKRRTVAAVQVSFTVRGANNTNADPLALTNLVGMPNLGFNTEMTP